MIRRYREEELATLAPEALSRITLPALDRELDWHEIGVMTRAGQARALGIRSIGKGHLAPGAEADIAIYPVRVDETDPSRQYQEVIRAFQKTAWTVKRGRPVARDGEILDPGVNKTIWARSMVPGDLDMGKDPEFAQNFDRYYTVRMSNYPVQDLYLKRSLCMESVAELDPFGFSPRLTLEAARAGYRVLVTVNNPITRFLLETSANPPSESDFKAALADMAVIKKARGKTRRPSAIPVSDKL